MPEERTPIFDMENGTIISGSYVESQTEEGVRAIASTLDQETNQKFHAAGALQIRQLQASRDEIGQTMVGLDQAVQNIAPLFKRNKIEWGSRMQEIRKAQATLRMHDKSLDGQIKSFNALNSIIEEETGNVLTRVGRDAGKVMATVLLPFGVDPLNSWRSSGYFTDPVIEGYTPSEIAQRTGKFVRAGTQAYKKAGGSESDMGGFIVSGGAYGVTRGAAQEAWQAFEEERYEDAYIALAMMAVPRAVEEQLLLKSPRQRIQEEEGIDETEGGKVAGLLGELIPSVVGPLAAIENLAARGIGAVTGISKAGKALKGTKIGGSIATTVKASKTLPLAGAAAGGVAGTVLTEGDVSDKIRGGLGGVLLGYGAGTLPSVGKGFLKGVIKDADDAPKVMETIFDAVDKAGTVERGAARTQAAQAGMGARAAANASTGDVSSTLSAGLAEHSARVSADTDSLINRATEAAVLELHPDGVVMADLSEAQARKVRAAVGKKVIEISEGSHNVSDEIIQQSWYRTGHDELAINADPTGKTTHLTEDIEGAFEYQKKLHGARASEQARLSELRAESLARATELKNTGQFPGKSKKEVADLLYNMTTSGGYATPREAIESMVGKGIAAEELNTVMPRQDLEPEMVMRYKSKVNSDKRLREVVLIQRAGNNIHDPIWEVMDVQSGVVMDLAQSELRDPLSPAMQARAELAATQRRIDKKMGKAAETTKADDLEGVDLETGNAEQVTADAGAADITDAEAGATGAKGSLADDILDDEMDSIVGKEQADKYDDALTDAEKAFFEAGDRPTSFDSQEARVGEFNSRLSSAVKSLDAPVGFLKNVHKTIFETWNTIQAHKAFNRKVLLAELKSKSGTSVDPDTVLEFVESVVFHPDRVDEYATQIGGDFISSRGAGTFGFTDTSSGAGPLSARTPLPSATLQNLIFRRAMQAVDIYEKNFLNVADEGGTSIFTVGNTFEARRETLAKLVREEVAGETGVDLGQVTGRVGEQLQSEAFDLLVAEQRYGHLVGDVKRQFGTREEAREFLQSVRNLYRGTTNEKEANNALRAVRKHSPAPSRGQDLGTETAASRAPTSGSIDSVAQEGLSVGRGSKASEAGMADAALDATRNELRLMGWGNAKGLATEDITDPIEVLLRPSHAKMREEILANRTSAVVEGDVGSAIGGIEYDIVKMDNMLTKYGLQEKSALRTYWTGMMNSILRRGWFPDEVIKTIEKEGFKLKTVRQDSRQARADWQGAAILSYLDAGSVNPEAVVRMLVNKRRANTVSNLVDDIQVFKNELKKELFSILPSDDLLTDSISDAHVADKLKTWLEGRRGDFGLVSSRGDVYRLDVSPKFVRELREGLDNSRVREALVARSDLPEINIIERALSEDVGGPMLTSRVQLVEESKLPADQLLVRDMQERVKELQFVQEQGPKGQELARKAGLDPEIVRTKAQAQLDKLLKRGLEIAKEKKAGAKTAGDIADGETTLGGFSPGAAVLAAGGAGAVQEDDDSSRMLWMAAALGVALGVWKGPAALRGLKAKFSSAKVGEEVLESMAKKAKHEAQDLGVVENVHILRNEGRETRSTWGHIVGARDTFPVQDMDLPFVPRVLDEANLGKVTIRTQQAYMRIDTARKVLGDEAVDQSLQVLKQEMINSGVTMRGTLEERLITFGDDGRAYISVPETLDVADGWQKTTQRSLVGPKDGDLTFVDFSGNPEIDVTRVPVRITKRSRARATESLSALHDKGGEILTDDNVNALATVLDGTRQSAFLRHFSDTPPKGSIVLGGVEMAARPHGRGILEVSLASVADDLDAAARAASHGVPPSAVEELANRDLLDGMFSADEDLIAGSLAQMPIKNKMSGTPEAFNELAVIMQKLSKGTKAQQKIAELADSSIVKGENLLNAVAKNAQRGLLEAEIADIKKAGAFAKSADREMQSQANEYFDKVFGTGPEFGAMWGGDLMLSLKTNSKGMLRKVLGQLDDARTVKNVYAKDLRQVADDLTRMVTDPDSERRVFNALDTEEFGRLTDDEKAVAFAMRSIFNQALEIANVSLRARGKAPIKKQRGYITHIFESNKDVWPKISGTNGMTPDELRNANFFKKDRKGLLGYKRGLNEVMDTYLKVTLNDAVFSPVYDNINALNTVMNPGMSKAVTRVADLASGRHRAVIDKITTDAIGKRYAKIRGITEKRGIEAARNVIEGSATGLAGLTRLVTLGWTPRSGLLQYLQIFPTIAQLGPENAAKSMRMLMEGGFGVDHAGAFIGAAGGFIAAPEDAGIGVTLAAMGGGAVAGGLGGRYIARGMQARNPASYAKVKNILDQVRPGWNTEHIRAQEELGTSGVMKTILSFFGDKLGGFALMESTDRLMRNHAAVAGYLEGAQRGMKGQALIDFASDAVASTQFIYSGGSTPGLIVEAGKIGSPATVLKSYPMRSMSFWAGRINAAKKAGFTSQEGKQILGRMMTGLGAAAGFAFTTSQFGIYTAEDVGVAPYEMVDKMVRDPSGAPGFIFGNPVTQGFRDLIGTASNDPGSKGYEELIERYILPNIFQKIASASTTQYFPNTGSVGIADQKQVFKTRSGFSTGQEATSGLKVMKAFGFQSAKMIDFNEKMRNRGKKLERYNIARSRGMRRAARLILAGRRADGIAAAREVGFAYDSNSQQLEALILAMKSQQMTPIQRQLQREPDRFTQQNPLDITLE